jgi:hypothetical protein
MGAMTLPLHYWLVWSGDPPSFLFPALDCGVLSIVVGKVRKRIGGFVVDALYYISVAIYVYLPLLL